MINNLKKGHWYLNQSTNKVYQCMHDIDNLLPIFEMYYLINENGHKSINKAQMERHNTIEVTSKENPEYFL